MNPKESFDFLLNYLRNWSAGADHFKALEHAGKLGQWVKALLGPAWVTGEVPEAESFEELAALLESAQPSDDPNVVAAVPFWLIPILLKIVERVLERIKE